MKYQYYPLFSLPHSPLVNVEIGIQISREGGSRRRASCWTVIEVVLDRSLHAHVSEVEAKAVASL